MQRVTSFVITKSGILFTYNDIIHMFYPHGSFHVWSSTGNNDHIYRNSFMLNLADNSDSATYCFLSNQNLAILLSEFYDYVTEQRFEIPILKYEGTKQ